METYALSKPQKLIYDLELYAGGTVSNISASVLFKGKADVVSLEKAIDHIIKNSDAFNIKILLDGSQTIKAYEKKEIKKLKFSSLDEFHAYAAKTALKEIDIYGSLFSIDIVSIGDECFGTLINLHHIIFDAWSAAFYASKLYEYYTAFKENTNPKTENFSYIDYIQSEKDYAESGKFQRDKAFWEKEFENFSEPVFLSEKTTQSLASNRLDYTLSESLSKNIRDFAAEHSLSAFSVFLTAMSVYIARIKDASSFQIGTTVLNRSSRKEKATFGMFANTLALPISVDFESSFLQNAIDISSKILPALRHQRYNYNDVLADVQKNHGYGGKLYDVLINYQNATVSGMDDNFLATYWYYHKMQPETLQIQLNDRDNFGKFYLSYDYQTEKLSKENIKSLHNSLIAILSEGFKMPQTKLKDVSIVSKEEKQFLVQTLNETKRKIEGSLCIHKYFEEQAIKQPDKPAMIYDRDSYTYEQLNNISDKIANFLREQSISEGSVVALLLERCAEMMPIILGTLKAGCTYMPISTSLPKDRIDYILKNANASLIFYQDQFKSRLDSNVFSVEVKEIWDFAEPKEKIESADNPQNVAYILYTSGSTGNPKGVQIEHHSVCNRLLWMHDKYPLAEKETLIQKTNYAFDVSVWELFWAFMTGRTLLIPPPEVEKDPERLIEYIRLENVKKIHFVPSMLSVFLDYLAATKTQVTELKQVIVSGEALTPSLNKRFYSLFSQTNASLHNLYGPTECTVDVLYYDCLPNDAEIPIGRPVWNTAAYVLSKDYKLLPAGIEGELAISGVQLARGYVDTSLNDGRFIDDTEFGRIYMTGDKAMVRKDGEILYLGRNDDQIKIRGQRVELTDIEETMLAFSGVLQVAVLFNEEKLYSFYKADNPISKADFSAFLADKLPSYMIPSSFVKVDEFPLNANGKLARKQLLALSENEENDIQAETQPQDLPSTEQERQIHAVISKYIAKSNLSVTSNLLNEGLTSLQIISVISDLSELGTNLKVNDFYTLENIRQIAGNTIIKNRPIIHTYNQTSGDTAILCIPYGGGSFGSFAGFAEKISQKFNLPSVAVQNAHISPDELLKSLLELPYKNLFVLGVCVGSGLAINISKLIESNKSLKLKALYLISSIPPLGVKYYGRFFNPWKFSSNSMINSYLQGLSEKEFRLGQEEIMQFRDDVSHFLKYLAKNTHTNINAPIRLIYGVDDPMINAKHTKTLWQKHFKQQIILNRIENAKHYIIHTHIDEILNFISKDFNAIL